MLHGLTLTFVLLTTGCGGGSGSSPPRSFSPVWSPNGKQIAYTVVPNCGAAYSVYCLEVWIMGSDGAHPRKLADGDLAAWSPDARTIAFDRFPSGIYSVRGDGTHVRRLTKASPVYEHPVWSQGGRKLVFVGAGKLYVINADGTRLRRLTHLYTETATWLADGETIAFATGHGLYTVSARGRDLKKVFSTSDNIGAAAWSPDAKTVAFRNGLFGLYRIGTDGRSLRKLSPDRIPRVVSTSWSPEGQRIAVGTAHGIYALNADGSGWRLLAYGSDPTWSPDGRRIAFATNGGVYVMNADGTARRRVSKSNE